MNIGITGGGGFVGYHTYYILKHVTDWNIIKLDRDFYNDYRIKKCDWVIHLAGMNRGDEDEIYNTNIELTQKLVDSVSDGCNIIFSSSTQADLSALQKDVGQIQDHVNSLIELQDKPIPSDVRQDNTLKYLEKELDKVRDIIYKN